MSARYAFERDPIPISISNTIIFFSLAFVTTSYARNNSGPNWVPCSLSSPPRGTSHVFMAVSEVRAASHRFEHVHVWNLFKKVPKLSRPLNSDIVKRTNILVLVCCAGTAAIGAAIAGAAAWPLLSMMRSNRAKCSSVKSVVRFSSSFRKYPIFCSAVLSHSMKLFFKTPNIRPVALARGNAWYHA